MKVNFVTQQVSHEDLMTINNLPHAVARKGMLAVELGVYTGKTAIYSILPAVKAYQGHYYGIDWFKGNPTCTDSLNPSYEKNDIKRILEENLRITEYDSCSSIIEQDTIQAATKFQDGVLDFIFIDADHRYSRIKNDIATWWPKLRQGGIMAGHDCDCRIEDCDHQLMAAHCEEDCVGGRHYGVIRAVCERFNSKEFPQVNLEGRIWWVSKLQI